MDGKFICAVAEDCNFIEKNICYHATPHEYALGGCNRPCAFREDGVCIEI